MLNSLEANGTFTVDSQFWITKTDSNGNVYRENSEWDVREYAIALVAYQFFTIESARRETAKLGMRLPTGKEMEKFLLDGETLFDSNRFGTRPWTTDKTDRDTFWIENSPLDWCDGGMYRVTFWWPNENQWLISHDYDGEWKSFFFVQCVGRDD